MLAEILVKCLYFVFWNEKKKTIRVLVHDQLIKIEVTGFMKVFLETDNC